MLLRHVNKHTPDKLTGTIFRKPDLGQKYDHAKQVYVVSKNLHDVHDDDRMINSWSRKPGSGCGTTPLWMRLKNFAAPSDSDFLSSSAYRINLLRNNAGIKCPIGTRAFLYGINNGKIQLADARVECLLLYRDCSARERVVRTQWRTEPNWRTDRHIQPRSLPRALHVLSGNKLGLIF